MKWAPVFWGFFLTISEWTPRPICFLAFGADFLNNIAIIVILPLSVCTLAILFAYLWTTKQIYIFVWIFTEWLHICCFAYVFADCWAHVLGCRVGPIVLNPVSPHGDTTCWDMLDFVVGSLTGVEVQPCYQQGGSSV